MPCSSEKPSPVEVATYRHDDEPAMRARDYPEGAIEPLSLTEISPRKVVGADEACPVGPTRKRRGLTTSLHEQPLKKGKRNDSGSTTMVLQASLRKNVNVGGCNSSLGSNHGAGKVKPVSGQGPDRGKGKGGDRGGTSGFSGSLESSRSKASERKKIPLRKGARSGQMPNLVGNVVDLHAHSLIT